MAIYQTIAVFLVLSVAVFYACKKYIVLSSRKSLLALTNSHKKIYSLPKYYGYCAVLWSLIPAVILLVILVKSGFFVKNGAVLASFFAFVASAFISIYLLKPSFDARKHFEGWVKALLIFCAGVSVSITLLIFVSVLFESVKFFEKVSFIDFFFGLEWSPQTALRIDQAGSSGKFGIIPVFLGTLLITLIAMVVSIPLGLMSAIYLNEYSSKNFRASIKPVLEILAGIPTVVYGYFAAITLGPLLRDLFSEMGVDVASESALAAGFVMGVMIIPYIMSLTDDVMNAVPRSLRDASLGLGATKSETIRKVVIPAALPGIMGAFLLAISRAIGETMIVTMAAGLIAKLTINPLDSVTTVTAQIVRLLVGDQEFDSAKTLSAFALSLTLFLITLMLNVFAIIIVKKYREKYD